MLFWQLLLFEGSKQLIYFLIVTSRKLLFYKPSILFKFLYLFSERLYLLLEHFNLINTLVVQKLLFLNLPIKLLNLFTVLTFHLVYYSESDHVVVGYLYLRIFPNFQVFSFDKLFYIDNVVLVFPRYLVNFVAFLFQLSV